MAVGLVVVGLVGSVFYECKPASQAKPPGDIRQKPSQGSGTPAQPCTECAPLASPLLNRVQLRVAADRASRTAAGRPSRLEALAETSRLVPLRPSPTNGVPARAKASRPPFFPTSGRGAPTQGTAHTTQYATPHWIKMNHSDLGNNPPGLRKRISPQCTRATRAPRSARATR